MLRSECKKGMQVLVDMGYNKQSIKAKVVKVNPKTATVEILEPYNNHPVGTPYRASYNILSKLDANGKIVEEKMEYNPFDELNSFYECILECYSNLSPENLSCDGELPIGKIRSRRAILEHRLRHLCEAIQKEISEEQIYDWLNSKREYERKESKEFDF